MIADRVVATPYHDVKNPFTVDETGAFAEFFLRQPERMPDLALGASLLIKDKRNGEDLWVVGSVVELKAISPFEMERQNQLYIDELNSDPTVLQNRLKGPHSHQPMIIRVRLDRELTRDRERKFVSSAVQRPPSSSSYLFFPSVLPEDRVDEPSLQDMLEIQAKGLDLGAVGFGNVPYERNKQLLIYKWDIDSLDNKHIFIVGESGSGKTLFLKNLVLQLRGHEKSTRVIMTDLQGDISQLLIQGVVSPLKAEGWQSKVLRLSEVDANSTLKPFQLLVPATNSLQYEENLSSLIRIARHQGVRVYRIGLRLQDLNLPSDVEYLFNVTSGQVALLLDEEAEFLRNRRQQLVTIHALRERINFFVNNSGNSTQISSDGGTPYYASTYYAALRALRNLANYFDNHQPSMDDANNPLDYLNFDGTTILYLEHLGSEERLMWEMQLVNWLYNHKRDLGKTFVFFDEAHQIVPVRPPTGGGARETFFRLRKNFENLAREGRKFEINLVLSTQSPRDLHSIVPEQCSTRIVMKIDPRNAEASFLNKDLASIAYRFGPGQFWIYSPLNGTSDWVRVHSWVPPLPHSPMTTFWRRIKETASKLST